MRRLVERLVKQLGAFDAHSHDKENSNKGATTLQTNQPLGSVKSASAYNNVQSFPITEEKPTLVPISKPASNNFDGYGASKLSEPSFISQQQQPITQVVVTSPVV